MPGSSAIRVATSSAREGSTVMYEQLLGRLRGSHEPEEHARFLHALADFEEPSLVQRTLGLMLTRDVRVQDLGRAVLSGLDAKKWVDALQDRVVTPALLTAERMPFTDAVTLQHILRAGRDFFAAGWTTAEAELIRVFSVRWP